MRADGGSSVPDDLGRNLTWGLHERVGAAIVAGQFSEKRFPTEAELGSEFGVSRSVAREAVKMLTAKRLLAARPKQGTYVLPSEQWNLLDPDVLRWMLGRPSSLATLRHFAELRFSVEPAAARLAARRATREAIHAIDLGLERMRAAEAGLDDPVASDIAFHVAILAASGNPFYWQFRDVVATALKTSIVFTNKAAGRTADLLEHAAIRNAVVAGNEDAAERQMRRIIDAVLSIVASSWDERECAAAES